MNQKEINKHIFLVVSALIAVILFFSFLEVDRLLQDSFYIIAEKRWIFHKDNNQLLHFIFYDAIKRLLILFSLCILGVILFFSKRSFFNERKHGLVIVLLSMIFVPVIVGGLKASTNTPCPKNLIYYDGKYPDVKILDRYPDDFKIKSKSKCWPAGHASGGFALMSTMFFFKSRRNKILALIFSLIIGWIMGSYKILMGDHFLSHTIVTMLISWLVILIVAKSIYSYFGKDTRKVS